jgi:2,3-diketo-5-methylthio-1-phosphopentane phosphatase
VSLVVLCDFDATAVNIDTCVLILTKFTGAEWKTFDIQFENGEISLEECLRKEFSLMKAPRSLILREVERATVFRPNFKKLVEYCNEHRIPLILVSAGLDFVIRHFLKLADLQGLVEVYAPMTKFGADGIEFAFPKPLYETSINFKDDLVKQYEKMGIRVLYVGDGTSDFQAAKNAHLSFAIKGSKLANLLNRDGIPHEEIIDFQAVIESIKVLNSPTNNRLRV